MEYAIYTLGALFVLCQLVMLLCKFMNYREDKAYQRRVANRISEERVKQRLILLGDELDKLKLKENGRSN